MVIKNSEKNDNIVIFNKCIHLLFLVFLLIFFITLLVSCNKRIEKPSFKILNVNFVSSIDEDMVQKGIDGGMLYLAENRETQNPEILYMHIDLENPKSAPIDYVTVNNKKYINQDESTDKINTFSANSYYSKIIVKLSALSSNTKQITLGGIGYRLPNERVDYKTQLNMNVIYNPEFVVTCDLTEISQCEEHISGVNVIYDGDGNVVKKTKELRVKYLDRFILPYNNFELTLSERQRDGVGRCPLGKGFVGWYTVEEEPKLVNPNDTIFYSYVKNIEIKPKFVDRYLYEDCEYEGVQGVSIAGVNIVQVMYKNNPILKNELKNEYIPDVHQHKPILGISPRAFSDYKAGDFKIYLGNNIKYIGENAFEGVKKMQIDLNVVEEIGDFAFKNCGDMVLINKEFPSTLWKIGKEAFFGATPKEYVVKNIDENSSLTANLTKSIFIPNTIKNIGDNAFDSSEILGVYFESGLELDEFGESCFANCRELKTFVMNALRPVDPSPSLKINEIDSTTIQVIPKRAFYNCISIKHEKGSNFTNNGINGYFYLAEGVEDIKEEAFAISNISASKKSFKYLPLPSSLKYLGAEAFKNVKLLNIDFPSNSNLESVGKEAFNNSLVEEVKFPKINEFRENVFINNFQLEAIFIEHTDKAFISIASQESTFSLKGPGFMNPYFKFFVPEDKLEATKNENGDKISKRILSNKYVCEISKRVDNIDYKYKISYEDINPGENEDIRITNVWGKLPYMLTISNTIPYDNGITIINKNVKELGPYCLEKPVGKITLPKAIVKIGDCAFKGNKSLYWLNIIQDNDSEIELEEIGQQAFNGTSITTFVSNFKLRHIGVSCFLNCSNLRTINLTNGMNIEIQGSAFSLCGVEKIYLGNNDVIKSVGASAFTNCANLQEVYIEFSDEKKFLGAVYVFSKFEEYGTFDPNLKVCFPSYAIADKMMTGYSYFKNNKIYYTNWLPNGMPDETNKILVYSPPEN